MRPSLFTHPYARLMRLHQPVGSWLVFWPALWGMLAAIVHSYPEAPAYLTLLETPSLWHIVPVLAAGAIIMRSAGCILNDLADRNFDGKVERTRTRPLASGEVTPKEALMLAALLLLMALGLALLLPWRILPLTLLTVPMVAAYPFMKRFTWWPQIFLGVTFNLGVLIAWCAVTADWGATPFLIYLAAIFWTFGYDTIYAHQDKEDDAAIGVKSSARRLGAATLPVTRFCYVMASVALIIAGLIENAGWLFWPIILAFLLLQLKSLKGLNLDHRQQCHQAFRLNRLTGALPALAWLAS